MRGGKGSKTINIMTPPPHSIVDEKSLPLTFFDMPWLHFPYEVFHPKAYFVDSIVPRLKQSLSLTLKHFFSFFGNLIFPTYGSIPEIRYTDAESVSLIFASAALISISIISLGKIKEKILNFTILFKAKMDAFVEIFSNGLKAHSCL